MHELSLARDLVAAVEWNLKPGDVWVNIRLGSPSGLDPQAGHAPALKLVEFTDYVLVIDPRVRIIEISAVTKDGIGNRCHNSTVCSSRLFALGGTCA